jgi:hypothetical protein
VGTGFFPLDKDLDLPSVGLLPHASRSLTRLTALVPFAQAAQTFEELLGITVSRSTVRRLCLQVGQASQQVQDEQAHPQAQVPEEAPGEQMIMSTDGAFVPLVGGGWGEVKLLSIGEVQPASWNPSSREMEIKTQKLSYFARLEEASRFSDQASGEMRRRGIERATAVCAVQDGALWLQEIVQAHRKDAVRILDFAHAAEYVHEIGEAVRATGRHLPARWLQGVLHRLKHDGPDRVLKHVQWLAERINDPEVQKKERYLSSRREQMDYPTFQRAGWPIGSGIVESGNKVVMQARLKGAGMHWKPENVNPVLALRMALYNERWQENWQAQWKTQQQTKEQCRWLGQQERVKQRKEHAKALRILVAPPPPQLEAKPLTKPKGRTAAQHRWGRQTFSQRALQEGRYAKK